MLTSIDAVNTEWESELFLNRHELWIGKIPYVSKYIYIYETKQNYSFVHCDTVEISNSKLCTHTHCEAFSEHAYYKLFNTD